MDHGIKTSKNNEKILFVISVGLEISEFVRIGSSI